MSVKRKLISVNESTYLELKQLGLAGDSFNHFISRLLKSAGPATQGKKTEEDVN
jgi:predicted CopG family antitoxin